MDQKTTMTLAEAAAFQATFDAVETGTATAAQLAEAEAVDIALNHYLRDRGAERQVQSRGRAAMLAALPEDRRAKVVEVLDGDSRAPTIWWDNEAKTLVTEETAEAVELAKAEARAMREAPAGGDGIPPDQTRQS